MDTYPEIESAAADTTCTQQQGHPPPSSPDISFPSAKRRRMSSEHQLDDPPSFVFPPLEESRRRASGPSSFRHPSGRVIPVGIAQPMQSRGNEQKEYLAGEWDCKTDTKPPCGEGEGGETGPLRTKGYHKSTSSSTSVEVEEDVQKAMSQMETESSSESDSESSTEDGDDDNGMELSQQPDVKPQYGNETKSAQSFKTKAATAAQMMRTSSSASLPPMAAPSGYTLPPGKKLHVFLSHSTGDQNAVKGNIVVPLRETHHMQVIACYHCMEDKQYNDRHIQRAMSESCVVVLALSPSYLDSQRCQREWRYGCELASRSGKGGRGGESYQVVVAAVGKCSRPEQLKNFLYLDFINRDKRDYVLKKLVDTITAAVGPASEDVGDSQLAGEDDGNRNTPSDEEHSNHNINERDLLSLGGYGANDAHHQLRMAEFEAEFGEGWGNEEQPEFSSSGLSGQSLGSSDPRMAELAASRGVETIPAAGPPSSHRPQEESKRKRREKKSEEVEEGEVSDSSSEGKASKSVPSDQHQSQQVAKFYDHLAQPDADKRDESPIFYMRNFNNWVKSVLLRTYIQPHFTVLDLCCGKGGDLLKWKEGGIGYLICADISESSVEACKGRYNSHRMAIRGTRKPPFEAEFYVADCCSVRLRDLYQNSGCSFNIVSCQFSVHYSFESYSRAHMMLRNACENLRPGGYFIGTTVDSNEIVRRLRDANQRNEEDGSWYIGNEVYSVTLDPSLDPWMPLPLFKAKYNFKLHGVVDLPEFLIHFPLFVEMLKDFDMELVLRQNFTNFFSEQRYNPQNANLMFKMQAFNRQTATMPAALWEVIGLYLVYVFRKRDHKLI